MRPILFRFLGREIRSYPALLFLGLSFGVVAGTQAGVAAGVDPTRLYVSLILLTIPALIGSRLMYVLTHLDYYRRYPAELWATTTGGASLYGGILLALALSWPVLRATGVSIGAFWDAATVTLLVGMAFTRVGCILNGCCAGRPTSSWLGVEAADTRGVLRRRFPTQMMESALAVLLLILALQWDERRAEGTLFLTAMAIYAAARIAIGPFREQSDNRGSVRAYYVVSVILLVASTTVLILRPR